MHRWVQQRGRGRGVAGGNNVVVVALGLTRRSLACRRVVVRITGEGHRYCRGSQNEGWEGLGTRVRGTAKVKARGTAKVRGTVRGTEREGQPEREGRPEQEERPEQEGRPEQEEWPEREGQPE